MLIVPNCLLVIQAMEMDSKVKPCMLNSIARFSIGCVILYQNLKVLRILKICADNVGWVEFNFKLCVGFIRTYKICTW